jgi:glutamine cyclotransferase
MNGLLRVAFAISVGMLGTTALADPPIINGGEAPQIGRARVYDQTGIPVYTHRILATYPHDNADYTEALFMYDGYLYEGTGQYGKSLLKKSRLTTGEVIGQRVLDRRYFGEGAVALNGKVYHLTYISNTGFTYRHDDLSPEKTFEYPRQGWGLTTDGESLIASDGSAVVVFLDPETFAIRRSVIVKDGYSTVGFLNELEYVDGDIYANVWQTNYIVRFSAKTGSVNGWVDLDGLNPNPIKLVYPHVLNGIAYDGEPGTLLVTGKNWPNIWRIEPVPVAHTDRK